MSTSNGPDDRLGGRETVSAILTRVSDGKKTVIAEKRGVKEAIKAFVRRVEPLFTRF